MRREFLARRELLPLRRRSTLLPLLSPTWRVVKVIEDAPASAPRTHRLGVPGLPTRERLSRYVLKLVFELAVIFIGVYAAFAVESYQREREVQVRRQQLEAALVREIEGITQNTRNAALGVGRLLAAYDSAWTAGGTPALQPMIEPIRFQAHMWEATLESGGLELLDVPTVYRLSEFYNELNAGFEQLEQLRQLSETMLLPQLEHGAVSFYDPATGRLRPQYWWYTEGLRNLRGHAEQITALGDSLVADLNSKTGGAAPQP